MTDKREPSFEQNGAPAEPSSAGGKPAPAAAPAPSLAPRPQRSGRTPPEEPAAFQRWIEIEKLKVELKRLEFEQQHLQAAAEPASNLLGYVTLALIAAVAGLLIYVVAMLVPLREEVTRLRTAQATAQVGDAAATAPPAQVAEAPSQAPASAPPAASASPSSAPDQAPSAAPAEPAPAPGGTPPAADASAPPAATPPANGSQEPAAQTPAAPTYTVRIFATSSIDKQKLERFANVARAAGFTVDVSSAEVFQPLRNALSYHPGVADAANRLARALQAKYPAINLDSKASPSITDIAKNVLILNVMDDAVN